MRIGYTRIYLAIFFIVLFKLVYPCYCKSSKKVTEKEDPKNLESMSNDLILKERFAAYKEKFGKNYTPEEEPTKYEVYKENMKKAAEMQAKAKALNPNFDVQFGETIFSDIKQEDFEKIYCNAKPAADLAVPRKKFIKKNKFKFLNNDPFEELIAYKFATKKKQGSIE